MTATSLSSQGIADGASETSPGQSGGSSSGTPHRTGAEALDRKSVV